MRRHILELAFRIFEGGATYHGLPKVGIRETDADGLVDEKDVRVLVPRMWVVRDVVHASHPARAYPDEYVSKPTALIYTTQLGDAPSSMNNPTEDEHPGPPFVQNTTGSASGSFLLSKK